MKESQKLKQETRARTEVGPQNPQARGWVPKTCRPNPGP